jgi:zinc transport system substrate-binding protein
MKKKIISGVLALLIGVMLISCQTNSKTVTQNTADEKLNIVVSIYPLKEFTEKIAGDKANVTS